MGLIGNTGQAIKSGVVRKTAKLIEQSDRKVFLDPSVSEAAKGHGIVLADSVELARVCDLLMVIGGDGTVLKVARDTAGSTASVTMPFMQLKGLMSMMPSAPLPCR